MANSSADMRSLCPSDCTTRTSAELDRRVGRPSIADSATFHRADSWGPEFGSTPNLVESASLKINRIRRELAEPPQPWSKPVPLWRKPPNNSSNPPAALAAFARAPRRANPQHEPTRAGSGPWSKRSDYEHMCSQSHTLSSSHVPDNTVRSHVGICCSGSLHGRCLATQVSFSSSLRSSRIGGRSSSRSASPGRRFHPSRSSSRRGEVVGVVAGGPASTPRTCSGCEFPVNSTTHVLLPVVLTTRGCTVAAQ